MTRGSFLKGVLAAIFAPKALIPSESNTKYYDQKGNEISEEVYKAERERRYLLNRHHPPGYYVDYSKGEVIRLSVRERGFCVIQKSNSKYPIKY